MTRCPVCGKENHTCGPSVAVTPVDIPARSVAMANGEPLVRVQTGPTSYIKMTVSEAKAYEAARQQPAAEPVAEADAEPAAKPAAKKKAS